MKKLFTLCALLLPLAASATTLYTTESVKIDAKPGSSSLGYLTVATPVEPMEQQGEFTKVLLRGWALKEYPSQVYQKPGIRIEYGAFDEEDAVRPTPDSQAVKIDDNEWVAAQVEGWVKTASLTADINKLWKEGAERLNQACSVCHAAPHADHFTANQWAAILPLKGGRTGHTRAGANALMFKYLQTHAK